jgi:serine/threonine protein kinase
LKNFSHF